MDKKALDNKVDSIIDELKSFIESGNLSDKEITDLNDEIDKLVYECLYYRLKLIS